MAYLNEVDAATVAKWLANFDNCPNNIYRPFQENEIRLTKRVYYTLGGNSNHINIYFGLDDNLNQKMIAVGAYTLDQFDGEETDGFVDILNPEGIYELYSNTTISLAEARQFISKWENENKDSDLYKVSFLLPRPNFVKLFLEDQADVVRIFFGMDDTNALKVMQTNPDAGSGDVVLNRSYPCPAICPKEGIK